jgi:nitrate reductase alpha subunit
MSPVSYASGARFNELIGAPMLSFYDWYADLPNASPQMFGDQTDVPESGDWWDAGYLIMWGSNVPLTRTPDAHWMTEARYRGQKVIAVAPDYAENVKFADEWVDRPRHRRRPGDGHGSRPAQGVLRRPVQVDFFTDYNQRFTDLPFLITLEDNGSGAYTPGKFLVAGDVDGHAQASSENAMWKPMVIDDATGEVVAPNGSIGFRYGDEGMGKWNLDLGDVDPTPEHVCRGLGNAGAVTVVLPRFDTPDGSMADKVRGVPVHRVGNRSSPPFSTSARPLRRRARGAARHLADRLRRRGGGRHPRLGLGDHRRPGGADHPLGARVGAERDRHQGSRHDPHGCRHEPLVPLRPDLPGDARAHDDHRLPGSQRWRLGALRRPGEGPPDHGLPAHGLRPRLAPAAAAHEPDGLLVRQHQPVPLRHLHADDINGGTGSSRARARWTCSRSPPAWAGRRPIRQFNRSSLTLADDAAAAGWPHRHTLSEQLKSGELKFAIEDPEAPENHPRILSLWRSNLFGSSAKGNEYFLKHLLGTDHAVKATEADPGSTVPPGSCGRRRPPRASSTCS